ncbi:acyl-CoA thioesterase [Alicyclobacillus acidocaldarius]|uniref:Thioesterase superfamily protein n=1 Tax=Alicyclobacillus acidocaldarius subsp. acidocaldarius (strain ATCC 27009 / DSM 446 / BCRC 14685 / JCM 5260 / KCTC 1825 / NBRC 15652 / NCIMB 11725 / NRRL B-14509 / 104-IA) TaxID=521098 RepID=C8WSD3_ALIAD|nr:thioesterase family protein [Alicyclobacillus acidocaldarius]ACV59418.1 thioesterase superfamily protein [Alicyclobacillus acidocaldarius subsp. acidocaldarius DSM 446]
MEGFRYHYDLEVRWSEVDAQRIVFNANYLMYLDLAYQEFFRSELGLYDDVPTTVIATSTQTFLKPARWRDKLSIWVRPKRIGNTSVTLEFVMTREGEPIFRAETVYVHVDGNGRPEPIPAFWRERLMAYQEEALA